MSEVKYTPEQQALFDKIMADDKAGPALAAADSTSKVFSTERAMTPNGTEEEKARLAPCMTEAVAKAVEKAKAVKPVSEESLEEAELVGDPKEQAFVQNLLQTHYLVSLNGDVRIARWVASPDSEQGETLQLFRKESFKLFYENKWVTVKTATGDKRVPAANVFLQKAKRYDGLVMDPKGGPVVGNHVNLWRGWGVEPKQGDWSLMQRHINEVLANGDATSASYILKWSAWAVQNPARRAEVALVFKGLQGCGKGTFGWALVTMFGRQGLHISDREHLVGRFNSHLMYCCLLYADEAYWAGDVKGEGSLKSLITEQTLHIEPKGVNPFTVRNNLHVIMTSNNDWVVPASADARRYAVFNVSGARVGDKAYFDALHAELDNGGRAAMLHDLLSMDLKGWHPRYDVPDTEGLRQQKLQSLRGVDAIVYEMAMEATLQCAQPGRPDVAVTTGEAEGKGFWEWCKRTRPELRHDNAGTLSMGFAKWGFKRYHSGPVRGQKAPPLKELRAMLDAKFGQQAWDEHEEWGKAAPMKPILSLVDALNKRAG